MPPLDPETSWHRVLGEKLLKEAESLWRVRACPRSHCLLAVRPRESLCRSESPFLYLGNVAGHKHGVDFTRSHEMMAPSLQALTAALDPQWTLGLERRTRWAERGWAHCPSEWLGLAGLNHPRNVSLCLLCVLRLWMRRFAEPPAVDTWPSVLLTGHFYCFFKAVFSRQFSWLP